ncbi:hypothetical protein [uncultured Agitococcus sp.]|uniref:hypothetical protein n=1 Tax=uncultured Agitococcus sp. TaxID=1506599 RepID=UPI0026301C20|nr:hypothetical protein [uncultured Agitococcus sp.]
MNDSFDMPFWYLRFWQLLSALSESKNETALYKDYGHLCGYIDGLFCAKAIDSKGQNSLFNLCNTAFLHADLELFKRS